MTELLTAAQMRAVETTAILSGAVSGLELMERAGSGVVAAMVETWPEWRDSPGHAHVLCGPGNNGGDGFVIARLLAERGWNVDVFLLGSVDDLPPDARANGERWAATGVIRPLDDAPDDGCDVIIDALFGTGLTRAVTGDVLEALKRGTAARRVAVDIPSGLCADSGRVLGGVSLPQANLTVSFHSPKLGHMLADGPGLCGALAVADIGLPHDPVAGAAELVDPLTGSERAALAKTQSWAHKYDHGHALVLTGGPGRTGAGRLAARGALRIGAGLVTLGVPPAAQQEVASQITALMLQPMADDVALRKTLKDERYSALCLGPALGLDPRARAIVAAALDSRRPVVLDADALTLIGGDSSLRARLHTHCVLTPHMGEFKRIFPEQAAELSAPASAGPAYSRVEAALDAAAEAGCTVLLKGPDTVVADGTGESAVHAALYGRAAPWLATAGAGDVLAGMVAGLLARGVSPTPAARIAAWCHVEAARRAGPGLIAEDLSEALPGVLSGLFDRS